MNLDVSGLPVWGNALIVVVTILVIAKGAHWVVESAARLAQRLGISQLIIGLTVVAVGTSAPEFAVTLLSAYNDQGNISVGNIVGSNVFNLGFILGGCALARAIPTSPTLVKRDGGVLAIGTLLLLALVAVDLTLDRYDGALLAVCLFAYLGYLFSQRKAVPGTEDELEEILNSDSPHSVARDLVELVGGLGCILLGSHFLVASATFVATAFGVSEWVIGVTIVAAGTSAPEFATSLAGIMKGRYAMSAGGVIGSDIFNVFGVLGTAGMLHPVSIDPASRGSLLALTGMVFLVLLFMRTGWRVSRVEGAILMLVAAGRWGLDFASRAG